MLVRLLSGVQQVLPSNLNTPPVVLVDTTVLYLVRVLIPHTVTCEQSHRVSGYCTVPAPIVITTGAFIVAVSGIA